MGSGEKPQATLRLQHMDPVLVVVVGGALVVAGLLWRRARSLVAGGGGVLAVIGALRAVFAGIQGDGVQLAVWAIVAVAGAAVLATALVRASRAGRA